MPQPTSLPAFAAVVVAAGKGLRAGQSVPKQFADWRGKPVVRHSVERLLNHGAKEVIVAIPPGAANIASRCLQGLRKVHFVTGGETRQQSVRNALEEMESRSYPRVLIHDAARPDLPSTVTRRMVSSLDEWDGSIPVLPVVDSLASAAENRMDGTVERQRLRRVQTPQAFRFTAILAAHRSWSGEPTAGDDAQVLMASGASVGLVPGDERLGKLTFAEDFMKTTPAFRTGMGFDVHRLVEGEDLWLGGIQVEHEKGLAGHSDADVGLHAVVDALLGAISCGDIGSHFPPSDNQWKDAGSDRFLCHAVKLVREAGYEIGNIDLTFICEAPKIGPYRERMRDRIAMLAGIDSSQVSVKATTTERLGFAGRGEGISASAVATVVRR